MKTSNLNLIKQSLRLSLSNIWRNKFLSLATVFVVGTILFIFNVILVVDVIAKDAIEDLNKKIDVIVYLKETTTLSQTQSLIQDLSQLEGITNIRHLTKTDALSQIKTTHPDLSLAFEKYELGNPLPASLNISTITPEYHTEISQFLNQPQYVSLLSNIVTNDKTTNNAIMASVFKNLVKVTNFTNQLTFWLIIIFVIGGTLIILNAIHITIFNRKKEIQIMKLVGASHWFIRSPFIIESIIYGTLAILLSFFMLFLLSKNVEIQQIDPQSYFEGKEFWKIIAAQFIATILLSIFSASLAVHEYLHEKRNG